MGSWGRSPASCSSLRPAIPEGGSPTPVFQATGWAAALKYLSRSPAVSGLGGCHSPSLGQHLAASLRIGEGEGALWGQRALWWPQLYWGGQDVCSPSCARGLPALPGSLLSLLEASSAASTTEAPAALMSFHIQSRSNC